MTPWLLAAAAAADLAARERPHPHPGPARGPRRRPCSSGASASWRWAATPRCGPRRARRPRARPGRPRRDPRPHRHPHPSLRRRAEPGGRGPRRRRSRGQVAGGGGGGGAGSARPRRPPGSGSWATAGASRSGPSGATSARPTSTRCRRAIPSTSCTSPGTRGPSTAKACASRASPARRRRRQGGEIEHGPDGEPTGVLKDTAMDLAKVEAQALRARRSAWPPRNARAASRRRWASPPSTTRACPSRTPRRTVQADAAGRLKVRVLAIPFIPNQGTDAALARLRALGVKTGDRKGRVTWGAVKFMCDGGMAAKTIAVTPPGPVDDPKNLGLLGWETPKLSAAMKAVREMGWQITAHGIGDRAIAQILDALEAALGPESRRPPQPHRPLRRDHPRPPRPHQEDGRARRPQPALPLLDRRLVPQLRARARGHVLSRQELRGPGHRGLGRERRGGDARCLPGGGSGRRWSARSTGRARCWRPSERVDVRTALKWYTAGGAYAGFEEKDKGMLAAGPPRRLHRARPRSPDRSLRRAQGRQGPGHVPGRRARPPGGASSGRVEQPGSVEPDREFSRIFDRLD